MWKQKFWGWVTEAGTKVLKSLPSAKPAGTGFHPTSMTQPQEYGSGFENCLHKILGSPLT